MDPFVKETVALSSRHLILVTILKKKPLLN